MKTAKCRGCGAAIIWTGVIPCDPEPVVYWQRKGAKGRVVTPNGEVVACDFAGEPSEATGIGYISHFATCPCGENFRKKTGSGQA